MNQNYIIGAVVVILVLGGGYFLYTKNPSTSDTATTTPSTTDTPNDTDSTPATAPTVSTDTKVAPTGTTAVVNGRITPNGAFTDYWYEYGASTNLGSKTTNQNVGSGFTSIPAPGFLTGLSKNTTFYIRLVAENSAGRTTGTTYSFVTTSDIVAPTGSAPTVKTLPATGVAKTIANLTGEVNPNAGITQTWFEYGTTQNLGKTTELSGVGSGGVKLPTAAAITNLKANTTYFCLDAQNQYGTVNGSIMTFKTK